MKYHIYVVFIVLGFFTISCQESVVEYVPPVNLYTEPKSLSVSGKIGDEDDDGTKDLSCSIGEGDWTINVEGGRGESTIEIEGMTLKWYKNDGSSSPYQVDEQEPIKRLDIKSRIINKSDFPVDAVGWKWWSETNTDGFKIVRELNYETETGKTNTAIMELVCKN